MKYATKLIFSAMLLILISCQNSGTNPKEISDAELIQAIIDADKISIGIGELPSNSKTVIEYDYNEYESESANKAYGLGYEVNMSGKGHKVGSRCEVYFNLEGKKLDPYGRNGKNDKSDWARDEDKGDWRCFDLLLPVTYEMPDGSTITVENEEDWDDLKEWYEENSDSEEKPELQFRFLITVIELAVLIKKLTHLSKLIVAISCTLGVFVVLVEYFSKSNWVLLKLNEVVFLSLLTVIISPLSSKSVFLFSFKSILPFCAIII